MEMYENRLKILVVLYKKKLYESETILSILKCKHELRVVDTLIIWNNSPTSLLEEEKIVLRKEMAPIDVIFEGDCGINHTLPFIYTSIYKKSDNSDILVLFDHDSNISPEYFTKLLDAIELNKGVNLFLPIVFANSFIVSPSYVFFEVKGIYWRKAHIGILKSKCITAINSGMAIRCSYLINIFEGYNMNLKFYETDNDFMYKYHKANTFLYVLDVYLNHTLNFYDESCVEDKLNRYAAMRQGRLTRMKTEKCGYYLLAYIQYLYFGLKCALKYKESRFIYLALTKY